MFLRVALSTHLRTHSAISVESQITDRILLDVRITTCDNEHRRSCLNNHPTGFNHHIIHIDHDLKLPRHNWWSSRRQLRLNSTHSGTTAGLLIRPLRQNLPNILDHQHSLGVWRWNRQGCSVLLPKPSKRSPIPRLPHTGAIHGLCCRLRQRWKFRNRPSDCELGNTHSRISKLQPTVDGVGSNPVPGASIASKTQACISLDPSIVGIAGLLDSGQSSRFFV